MPGLVAMVLRITKSAYSEGLGRVEENSVMHDSKRLRVWRLLAKTQFANYL